MKNLTDYPNKELSLHVFNTEYFYCELETDPDFVLALVAEEFIYTAAQLKELKNDMFEYVRNIRKFKTTGA